MYAEIVVELIGGPQDGLVRHFTDDPGDIITTPNGRSGFWPWETQDYYFWADQRMTEDGRRAYRYAEYHPLRFDK